MSETPPSAAPPSSEPAANPPVVPPAPAALGGRFVFGLVAVAAFAAAVVFIFYKGFGSDPRQVPFGLQDKPAPAFKLKRLDTGEEVTLAQFRGRPVVLNFWSTWCGPCRQEDPVLQWGYRNFKDQAVFLGVVFEDTEENVRKFLAENSSPYPQLVDPSGGMAVDYAVTGVPETYFIDSAGIIRTKYAAPIDPETLAHHVRAIATPRGGPR